MASPEEREEAERVKTTTTTGGAPSSDALSVQTLMDVERALGRLESSVEWLERSTAQHTKDLNGLGKIAHTVVTFGKLALAFIAGGIIAELIRHFYSK